MTENIENANNTSTSILDDVKKMLNIPPEDDSFDTDIIIDVNSAFSTLNQLGVGPNEGFHIVDKNTVWNDYIDDSILLEHIKTFIYLKVKMIFDPPLNGSIMQSFERQLGEIEWRIHTRIESQKNVGGVKDE